MIGPVPSSRATHLEALLLEDRRRNLLLLGLLAEHGAASFLAAVIDGQIRGVAYVGSDGLVVPAAIQSEEAAHELGAALGGKAREIVGEEPAVLGVLRGLGSDDVPMKSERLYSITADQMGPFITAALRKATQADIPALVAAEKLRLEERGLRAPAMGIDAAVHVSVTAGQTWVVFEGDALAFRADIETESRHGAHVSAIFTTPDFRRRGIGTLGLGQLARNVLARLPMVTALAPGDDSARGLVRNVGFGPGIPWHRVELG